MINPPSPLAAPNIAERIDAFVKPLQSLNAAAAFESSREMIGAVTGGMDRHLMVVVDRLVR